MPLRTCVAPPGRFVFGVHASCYEVLNLRGKESIGPLGCLDDGSFVENERNFPSSAALAVDNADLVFEIPNPLPFRGTTYILKTWADAAATDPGRMTLPKQSPTSLTQSAQKLLGRDDDQQLNALFAGLPPPLQLALATTSTDPADLARLAELSCELLHGTRTGLPAGLKFSRDATGQVRPKIHNHSLFEALANNPHLPGDYKLAMVLRAGVQGNSEIVGETGNGRNHVFEYLRRNSYIPGGHYASNMAEDAVRYRIDDLSPADLRGLRHLYYQRTFVRLAADLGLPLPCSHKTVDVEVLEELRQHIRSALAAAPRAKLPHTATLWGWNLGFDYAPTGYRLHASHQQIHTQYALLPGIVPARDSLGNEVPDGLPAYGCGDLVADTVASYRQQTGRGFFTDYIAAIRTNQRTDGNPEGPRSLVIHEDDLVMLFVPKAQTSQWELQIMPTAPVGNILEADTATRAALDRALLMAQKILEALGARLVTSIEFPKRFDNKDTDQRLLYALLPKLPESPGAMSEAQLRFINGHFPEDFAAVCRARLTEIEKKIAP